MQSPLFDAIDNFATEVTIAKARLMISAAYATTPAVYPGFPFMPRQTANQGEQADLAHADTLDDDELVTYSGDAVQWKNGQ